MARDYYDILGVSRSADPDELKRSYRRLARKYHPDVNKEPGAEDKFKEINKAYETLSDPQMRGRYDQFGEAGVSSAAGAGYQDFGDFGGFADIFETFLVVLEGVHNQEDVVRVQHGARICDLISSSSLEKPCLVENSKFAFLT